KTPPVAMSARMSAIARAGARDFMADISFRGSESSSRQADGDHAVVAAAARVDPAGGISHPLGGEASRVRALDRSAIDVLRVVLLVDANRLQERKADDVVL